MSKSFFVIFVPTLEPFTNINDYSDNKADTKTNYTSGENNAGY